MNNQKKHKVFLTGRDFVNWATDDDYFLTRKALKGIVEFTETPEKSDVIHAINWHSLLAIPPEILAKKIVISHIPHDVRHQLTQPRLLQIAHLTDLWAVPSRKSSEFAQQLFPQQAYVPYPLDHEIFFPMPGPDDRRNLRKEYGLPADAYLIGSFQRDTEGVDLITPKYIKGPDLFFETVRKAYAQDRRIHVVLAGPRRFWLRKKLQEAQIPFTFAGENIPDRDDLTENTLDHATMNRLYNAIDLYVVSSRMEGGPKAILECAAAGCKIISTDVGQARDLLDERQIYSNFPEAADLILRDAKNGALDQFTAERRQKATNHHVTNIARIWTDIYKDLRKNPSASMFQPVLRERGFFEKLISKIRRRPNRRLTIHHQFHKPPWGGGNQFLLALMDVLRAKNWLVDTELDEKMPVCLFNSFLIDFEKMHALNPAHKLILHRLDGPTYLVRGKDKEIDDQIFALNKKIANISIFQSFWSLQKTLTMGYRPVNPVLIENAVQPKIFNETNRIPFSRDRKIKLISSSWSKNPRKGGPIYKWLDQNLDWQRYEYTFVGQISEELQNIRLVPPVPSEELAELLRQHDIYITASDNDPCSNALIEALACGLPTIYYNRGGHPEIVGFGGEAFDEKEEIPATLEKVVAHYESYRNLVQTSQMSAIADKYIQCMEYFDFGS